MDWWPIKIRWSPFSLLLLSNLELLCLHCYTFSTCFASGKISESYCTAQYNVSDSFSKTKIVLPQHFWIPLRILVNISTKNVQSVNNTWLRFKITIRLAPENKWFRMFFILKFYMLYSVLNHRHIHILKWGYSCSQCSRNRKNNFWSRKGVLRVISKMK